MKKRYIIIILSIALIILYLIKIYQISPLLGSNNIFMYSYKQISGIKKEQENALESVCEYLSNVDNDVRWGDINPDILTYYCDNGKGGYDSYKVSLNDTTISTHIQDLDNSGVIFILKESNYIQFVVWTSLDSSCGLIYCEENPIIDYNGKTTTNKLSEDNWYYYTQMAD